MNQKKRIIFIKGLWRGMSGTLNLFSLNEPPAPVSIDIKPLRPAIENSSDAIRADWVQTGRDLDSAITKYGNKVTSSRSAA